MAKTRAIMTDTERERLAGLDDVEDIKVYQAKSRVRRRIEEELTFDVEILAEHHPELLEELRDVVCETEAPTSPEPQPAESHDTEPEAPATNETEPSEIEPEPVDSRQSIGEAVDAVAKSWDDTEKRLTARRRAAEMVLQHAIDSGEAVGKSSEIVERARAEFQVEGQNEETYWRKNIRPVLKEYGTYSNAEHGYMVESLSNE